MAQLGTILWPVSVVRLPGVVLLAAPRLTLVVTGCTGVGMEHSSAEPPTIVDTTPPPAPQSTDHDTDVAGPDACDAPWNGAGIAPHGAMQVLELTGNRQVAWINAAVTFEPGDNWVTIIRQGETGAHLTVEFTDFSTNSIECNGIRYMDGYELNAQHHADVSVGLSDGVDSWAVEQFTGPPQV